MVRRRGPRTSLKVPPITRGKAQIWSSKKNCLGPPPPLKASFSARWVLQLKQEYAPVWGCAWNLKPFVTRYLEEIIFISNYFVSFQCFHNMSKELLAPGGLTELSVIKLLLCDRWLLDPGAFQELNMSASRWSQELNKALNVLNLSLVM